MGFNSVHAAYKMISLGQVREQLGQNRNAGAFEVSFVIRFPSFHRLLSHFGGDCGSLGVRQLLKSAFF